MKGAYHIVYLETSHDRALTFQVFYGDGSVDSRFQCVRCLDGTSYKPLVDLPETALPKLRLSHQTVGGDLPLIFSREQRAEFVRVGSVSVQTPEQWVPLSL